MLLKKRKKPSWKLMKKLYDSNKLTYKKFFERYDLTQSLILEIPNDELIEVIYDYASFYIGDKTFEQQGEILKSLKDPVRATYLIWTLNSEVHNGGFDQYFFNPSGFFAYETLSYLKTIKANEFLNITKEAISLVNKENQSIKDFKYAQKTAEIDFDYPLLKEKLNELDELFYKYPEDLDTLLIDYIIANSENFDS